MQWSWFRPSNFCFGYSRPRDFVRFIWQDDVSLLMVLYRTVLTAFLLANFIYTVICTSENNAFNYYGIYLTNISYMILCFTHFLPCLIITVLAYFKLLHFSRSESNETPWYLKLLWLCYNVAIVAALTVTIGFWATIYPEFESNGIAIDYNTVAPHGINAIVVLIEVAVTAIPFRLLHFYLPVIYSIGYFLGDYIYIASGGTNEHGDDWVYPSMQWNSEPGKATEFSIAFVVSSFAIHIILTIFVWLRNRFCRCSTNPGRVSDSTQVYTVEIRDA